MNWYAFYDAATGALASLATDIPANLPANLAYVSLGATLPDQSRYDWDAATRAFVARAVVSAPLTPYEFVTLFTDGEMAGILAAAQTSQAVNVYLERLRFAQEVLLSDPATIAGVNALATGGLITTARASEILAYVKPAP